jgi:hypothetical protein
MSTAAIMRAMIALMMETVRISETLVCFNETTWRYIPEGSNLHLALLFMLLTPSVIYLSFDIPHNNCWRVQIMNSPRLLRCFLHPVTLSLSLSLSLRSRYSPEHFVLK